MYQRKLRKLTDGQVIQIKSRLRDGETSYQICKDYNVSWKVIRRIELNETYKDIQLED